MSEADDVVFARVLAAFKAVGRRTATTQRLAFEDWRFSGDLIPRPKFRRMGTMLRHASARGLVRRVATMQGGMIMTTWELLRDVLELEEACPAGGPQKSLTDAEDLPSTD